MADTKISALPASTLPLAGTEVLPIVQSGVTKQVSVANLTDGRALSATQLILTSGNLIVASGQGIDFSATPGTGTSELLSDYEEGTWTPAYKGSVSDPTVTYSQQRGYYVKIGRQVTVSFFVLSESSVGGSGDLLLDGLPFTASTDPFIAGTGSIGYNTAILKLITPQINSGTNFNFIEQSLTGTVGVVPVSNLQTGAAKYLIGTFTYFA